MCGRCLKTVVFVKLAGTIVECMHKHGSHTCVLRYQYTALQRILKQGCPQLHSLRSGIDSQTGKDHHWNRVRHVLTNGPSRILVRDGTCSQSVVAHDLTLWGRNDERAAGTTGLVAQSAAFEPLVERWFAAGE